MNNKVIIARLEWVLLSSYTPVQVYNLRSAAALRATAERADKREFIAHACAWQNPAMNHTALRAGCLSAR